MRYGYVRLVVGSGWALLRPRAQDHELRPRAQLRHCCVLERGGGVLEHGRGEEGSSEKEEGEGKKRKQIGEEGRGRDGKVGDERRIRERRGGRRGMDKER